MTQVGSFSVQAVVMEISLAVYVKPKLIDIFCNNTYCKNLHQLFTVKVSII